MIAVVPAPLSLTVNRDSAFVLQDSSAIVIDAPSDTAMHVGEMFVQLLHASTGFAGVATTRAIGLTPRRGIRLRVDASRQDLGDEGYAVVVTADSVHLAARTNAGLFHGVQTLRQLLPFEVESDMNVRPATGWRIPALTIVDRPRYAWRGAMLDVARHFFTVDEVKQVIDIVALYKLNTLHLHLTDDQGWRIEIKSRPKLASVSGASQMGGGVGGFYTQDDFREIVRYAAERFVTIVPEIEMPGHSSSVVNAYPEVHCTTRPGGNPDSTFYGICPDSAESFRLVDDVVREVSALSPGPYIHIGADEVSVLPPEQFVRFVERAQDIVTKYNKRMIGWEEIFRARLLPTTLVQLWRTDSARGALSYGSKLIMSPAPKVYLDMKYTPNTELGLDWSGFVEPRTSYEWDPATYLPGVMDANIVGIEAPLWTETVRNVTAAEYMILPRLPAIAELAWTPQAARRWDDFRERIAAHAPRWRLMGINYYPSAQIRWR